MFKKTNRRTVFVRLAALLLLSLLLSGTASVLMPALPGPLTAYAGDYLRGVFQKRYPALRRVYVVSHRQLVKLMLDVAARRIEQLRK